jgi:hypothetical protein
LLSAVRAGDCSRRAVTRCGFRRRLCRLAVPAVAPREADSTWAATLAALERDATHRFGLNPAGALDSAALCEAALAIASSPAAVGAHPMDAHQAVRLYYAA